MADDGIGPKAWYWFCAGYAGPGIADAFVG
jgi:hypothetical protein